MNKIKHIKWEEACQAFTEWSNMNVSKSTQNTYLESLNKIGNFYKLTNLSILDTNDQTVENFKAYRHSKGDKNSTINGCLAVLGNVFKILKKMELVDRIPEIKYLKVQNGKDRVLSRAEREMIVENAKNPLKLMILIALTTGIRKEGIFNLKWSEIQNEVLDIISKGGKRITVPIPKGVQIEIEKYKSIKPLWDFQGLEPSPYLFPSPYDRNKPRHRTGDAGLGDLLDSLGIKGVTFHSFRHTFASCFLRRTNNLKLLQEILGHSNISQTSRYCHVNIDDKQKAIQALEDDLTSRTGEDNSSSNPAA